MGFLVSTTNPEAASLGQAAIARIAARQAAGQTQPSRPKWAGNKVDLARILGVDRRTIIRYGKLDDAPITSPNNTYNVDEWEKHLNKHSDVETTGDTDIGAAKLETEKQRAEQLKLKNEETKGRLTDTEKLSTEIGGLLLSFRDFIYQKMTNEIPPDIAGVDVPQARIILRRRADEMLTELQNLFKKWSI